MAKARRDQFEDQLRDLQKDISNLSHKLAIPPNTSINHSIADVSNLDVESMQDVQKSFSSGGSKNYARSDKGEKLAQLMQEVHVAKREKDDAVYRLEHVRAENEEMRKSLQDAVRLKSDFERLKQDYESIRVSLESSERIRKQQKELINLLQRSHSIAVASDTGSIISFNSISTISHKGEAPVNLSSRRPVDLSSASLAAENREWLNKSVDFPSAPKVPTEVGDSNLSSKSSRRKSRSSSAASLHSAHANHTVHSLRPSTTDASSARSATPRSTSHSVVSSSAGRAKSAGSSGLKVRRRKSGDRTSSEHQYSASFSERAPSFSNIIDMNHSLVPNRHGEVIANVNRSANLSALGGENARSYYVPLRQPLDSLNSSTHSAHSAYGNDSHGGLYASQTSGYAPGMYVPGLGTPTLSAHLDQQQRHQKQQNQERLEPAQVGRPPRHPSAPGASPAGTPTARVAHSVHVPAVSREDFAPAEEQLLHSQAASSTPSTALKRNGIKSKSKKVATPVTPNSAFVRRIPPASPARSALKSPAPPRPSQSSSSRHASPNVRAASASGVPPSSTFGVSRRML